MKTPKAVETALAPRGGSYLADPVTGALTPLFVPETGMDPDYRLPGEAESPETPAAEDAAHEEQI
jgi:hypothetical protein